MNLDAVGRSVITRIETRAWERARVPGEGGLAMAATPLMIQEMRQFTLFLPISCLLRFGARGH